MVINKLSYRYALKNQTKKTITAINTEVNKAGPNQRHFDVPHSSVLHLSLFMFMSVFRRLSHLLLVENFYTKRVTPFFWGKPYKLQDKVIHDQANENNIHQHSQENDPVGKIFFVKKFHAGPAPYLALHLQSLRI